MSSLARCIARPYACPVLQTLLTRPICSASLASMIRPVRMTSSARERPINSGSLEGKQSGFSCYALNIVISQIRLDNPKIRSLSTHLTVPPSIRGTPNLLLSTPNLDSASATRKSAIRASSSPPATHQLKAVFLANNICTICFKVRTYFLLYTYPSIAAITGLVSSILVGPMGPRSIILAATTLAKF